MRLIGLAVVLAVTIALAPLAAEWQQAEKVRRIGFLSATILDSQTKMVATLPKTLPIIHSDHRT